MASTGDAPPRPSAPARALKARTSAAIASTGASDIRPATGNRTVATTAPPTASATPPPIRATSRTATAISSGVRPATIRLWLSCATVVASAPSRSGKPRNSASVGACGWPWRGTTLSSVTPSGNGRAHTPSTKRTVTSPSEVVRTGSISMHFNGTSPAA